ncbi:protein kinase, putative, partial [Bodo saltans]
NASALFGYRIFDQSHFNQHPVGSGGFGVVFKALENASGRIVTVKKTTLSKEIAENSRKEFDILKGLEHPNIACLNSSIAERHEKASGFIFMKWMSAGSKRSVIEQLHIRLDQRTPLTWHLRSPHRITEEIIVFEKGVCGGTH